MARAPAADGRRTARAGRACARRPGGDRLRPGPGGFTGVRLCASVVQGLAFGAGPGGSGLDAAGGGAGGARAGQARSACSPRDARMGEVYWAWFERGGDGLARASSPEHVAAPEQVRHRCRPRVDGGERSRPWIRRLSGLATSSPGLGSASWPTPGRAAIARLAAPEVTAGAVLPPTAALPVYVRDRVGPAEGRLGFSPAAGGFIFLQHRRPVIPLVKRGRTRVGKVHSGHRGRAADPRDDFIRPTRGFPGSRRRRIAAAAGFARRPGGRTCCWSTGCSRTPRAASSTRQLKRDRERAVADHPAHRARRGADKVSPASGAAPTITSQAVLAARLVAPHQCRTAPVRRQAAPRPRLEGLVLDVANHRASCVSSRRGRARPHRIPRSSSS